MRAVVTGMKMFKGDIENKSFDTTKLFVQLPVDPDNANQAGFAEVQLKFGDSNKFHEYKGLPFPCDCEIGLTQISRGGKLESVVTAIRPVGKVNQTTGEVHKPAA